MEFYGIDVSNLIICMTGCATLFGGLYYFLYKDLEIVHKEIEVLKEELKSIRDRNDKIITEQNTHIEGVYRLLLKKFAE
jgi:hypothetical protein